MVKNKNKDNSSNSLVFGRWPQTTTIQVIPWSLADGRSQKVNGICLYLCHVSEGFGNNPAKIIYLALHVKQKVPQKTRLV